MAAWRRASARRCCENAVYDTKSGQLITGSLHGLLHAARRQSAVLHGRRRTARTCTHNPLGVKGCGEAGAIGAPAAVMNAVIDALAPFGIHDLDHAGDAGKGLARDPRPRRRPDLSRSRERTHVRFQISASRRASPTRRRRSARHGEAKLVAGGMTLIPTLKQRLAKPTDAGRSRRHRRAEGHQARRQRHRHRRDDASMSMSRTRAEVKSAIPALADLAVAYRRSGGAQSRHHRRLDRQQRSGGGLSRRRWWR